MADPDSLAAQLGDCGCCSSRCPGTADPAVADPHARRGCGHPGRDASGDPLRYPVGTAAGLRHRQGVRHFGAAGLPIAADSSRAGRHAGWGYRYREADHPDTGARASHHGPRCARGRRALADNRLRRNVAGPDPNRRADPPNPWDKTASGYDPTDRSRLRFPYGTRPSRVTSTRRHHHCCPAPNRTDPPLPYLPAYGLYTSESLTGSPRDNKKKWGQMALSPLLVV